MKKKTLSIEHKKYVQKQILNRTLTSIGRWGFLFLLIGFWEFSAQMNWIDPFITSSPSRVWSMLKSLAKDGSLWKHSWVTLSETLRAFAYSTLIGTGVAILLYMFSPLRKILEPYIVVLNSLPKIALGPLIVVWVGVGEKAIILMGILICVIITTITMLASFVAVPEEKVLLLKTMGANKFQILTRLVLPNSFPDFISTLKINVGMSWVGTIMGEYLVSRAGLGYLIVYGGQRFALDLVMSSIVILCIMAGIMYFIVASIESYVLKRRGK